MFKRTGKIIVLIVSVCIAIIAVTAISYAGITGTRHDFTITGFNPFAGNFAGDDDEPCVYCHTPHGSVGGQTPLWNRNLSFTNGFTVYSSATMDSSPLNPPSTVTQLCLSCHDGVGAINAVLNTPGTGSTPFVFTGENQIGDLGPLARWVNIGEGNPASPSAVNLSNDHPVSIVWNNRGAGFIDPPTPPVKLVNGMVECTSCHDPHNNGAIQPGEVQFLITSNQGSAMCLSCHDK